MSSRYAPAVSSPLNDDVAALARFGGDGNGVTRLAWTPELRAGYTWLPARCSNLGLDVASIFIAKWKSGEEPAVPWGSHDGTAPVGGRCGGALVLAVAASQLIRRRQAIEFNPTE